MDKREHADRLRAVMAEKGVKRQAVADATGYELRTVTNWTSGETMPTDAVRAVLRRLFGPYDDEGDPVERALLRCSLTEDRRYVVLGFYKRQLREQAEERGA